MENKRSVVFLLIREYVTCAKYVCSLIKDTYDIGNSTFLQASKKGLIPKTGELEGGFKFSFHGGGCFFEFGHGAIDIDFGPENRCDGFDSFRLYNFLINSQLEKFKSIQSELAIRQELANLLNEGLVIQPGLYPNPDLFYLK